MTRRETRNLHLRVDDDVSERLETEAEARMLSVNRLAGMLIKEGLDRLIPAAEFTLTRSPRKEEA